MHFLNFDYKFSMARTGTELCGLYLGIPGFKLFVGFLMLECPVAGVFAHSLSRNIMPLPMLYLFADVPL